MTLKHNILKDILSVIAYGTSTARSSAAKLLFYYWPAFNPNLLDRKGLICKFAGKLNHIYHFTTTYANKSNFNNSNFW